MSKELVIGSNRHETKVAILEEDQLVEVYFQRANEYSLAGSIHKGRVTRVLPGMQSAFVDLGLERDTFLYVSDFFEENEDIDTVTEDKPVRSDGRDRNRGDRDHGQQAGRERSVAPAVEIPAVREFRQTDPEPSTEAEEEPVVEIAPAVANLQMGPGAARTDGRVEPTSEEDRGNKGDRHGRRSRRRRPRSTGIPENKYAQPGRESSTPSPEFRSEPRTESRGNTFESPVTSTETLPEDVIILPGESLAKYRKVSYPNEPQPSAPKVFIPVESAYTPEPKFQEAPDEQVAPDEEASPAPLPETLEEEAREIELTDRILSHGPETFSEKEEKFAEVRQDQPVSPFLVNDLESPLETEGPPTPEELPDSAAATMEAISLYPEPVAYVPSGYEAEHAVEDSDLEDLHASYVGPEGPETAILEPSDSPMALVYEHAGEEQARLHEEAPEPSSETDEPEPESEADGEAAEPGADSSGEVAPGQSATVRADGSRYMHRSSRRMRRRRGGSRPNQQSGDPLLASPPPMAGSGGTGAAVAQQAEGRQESGRREFNQERGRESSRESEREQAEERPDRPLPSISEMLKAGQEIIVQIAKEPLGQKGARITSHVALPGRYVVFMPSVTHLGVSRKIASDEERQRLKRILQAHREGTTGGFIVRTAGEGVPEDEIGADMDFLYKLWLDIRQKAEKKPAPLLLHYDLDVVQRILRDQVTEEFKAIWVDNEDMYENVVSFMQRFQPALVNRVKMYTRAAPIFDAFGITQELEKALRPKVWLKSGGYIVINQTEALVAIDINTGKYVGKSNRLEDTIVKTNTEAVKEIVRQIRLRDLGGIIVVDFIDMDERKNRQKVMQALEEAMASDKAPYKILQFNDFGLVAITRKRVKQSLERTLCSPCPYCEGAGYVKSVQTTIGEIIVEAQKIAKAIEGKDVLLRVHPEVAKVLKANDNKYLEEIEEMLGRPVLVKGDPALHTEKFDLG